MTDDETLPSPTACSAPSRTATSTPCAPATTRASSCGPTSTVGTKDLDRSLRVLEWLCSRSDRPPLRREAPRGHRRRLPAGARPATASAPTAPRSPCPPASSPRWPTAASPASTSTSTRPGVAPLTLIRHRSSCWPRPSARPAAASATGRRSSPTPAGPLSYAELDRLSDEAAAGLAALRLGEGDVVALALPSTPDYAVAYAALAKLGAISRRGEPPVDGRRARRGARRGPTRARAGHRRAGRGRPRRTCAVEVVRAGDASRRGAGRAPSRAPGPRAARAGPTIPSGWSPSCSRRAPRARPRAPCSASASWRRWPRPTSATAWDGGGPMLVGHPVRPRRVHDQAALVPATRHRPLHLLDRWRAADVLRLDRRQPHGQHRRRGSAARPAAAPSRLRRPSTCRAVQAPSSWAAPSSPPALVAEARERIGAAYSIRYSSTESGGVGTATAFDADDDEALFTVGPPRAGVELSRSATRTTGPVPTARSASSCLRSPTQLRGYWRDPAADRGHDPRRLGAHAATWASSTSRVPAPRRPGQGDVHPRRLQRLPARGRGGAGLAPRGGRDGRRRPGRTRSWARSASPSSSPRPGPRRRRSTSCGPTGRSASSAHKLPEALRLVDELPAHRRCRRSTARPLAAHEQRRRARPAAAMASGQPSSSRASAERRLRSRLEAVQRRRAGHRHHPVDPRGPRPRRRARRPRPRPGPPVAELRGLRGDVPRHRDHVGEPPLAVRRDRGRDPGPDFLNSCCSMAIAFLPFPTALLAQYLREAPTATSPPRSTARPWRHRPRLRGPVVVPVTPSRAARGGHRRRRRPPVHAPGPGRPHRVRRHHRPGLRLAPRPAWSSTP